MHPALELHTTSCTHEASQGSFGCPSPPTSPPLPCVQIAKLLVIPFVCLVEKFFLGSVFSREVLATIGLVVTGVAIV